MQPALKMKTKYTNRELFDMLVTPKNTDFVPSKEQYQHLVNPVIETCELYMNHPEMYESKIHVIHAFTGSGKTTVLTQHLLHKMKKYFSGVLISAPSKDLVTKLDETIDSNEFQVISLNSKNLQHYYDRDSYKKFPVFIVTQQFFHGEKNRAYFKALAETMYEIDSTKMGLGVFVDEVHRGAGNSSSEMVEINYGYPSNVWTGAIFNTLTDMIGTECAIVFGFSATPTTEQQMDDSSYFQLLSLYEREKEKSPFVNIFELPVKKADLQIYTEIRAKAFVRNLLVNSGILDKFRNRSSLRYDMDIPQPKMMGKVPQRHMYGISDCFPIDMISKELSIYAKDMKWDDLVICSYTGEKCFIDGEYVEKEDFVKRIISIKDRPVIILVVNGLNFGTDIPEISDICSFGIPNQKKPDGITRDEYVTMGIEQLYGRGLRGIPDIKSVIKQLASRDIDVSEKQAQEIINMFVEYLSTNIYGPSESPIHTQAYNKLYGETFRSKEGKEWLQTLYSGYVAENNLPATDLVGKGRERLKKVYDQTSALKRYKQKYCEYHGEACFELAYTSYVRNTKNPLSKEDYLNSELWDTQLQVDHKDGNRNNNDFSNFETLCANAHAEKTYRHGDCFNDYTSKNVKTTNSI